MTSTTWDQVAGMSGGGADVVDLAEAAAESAEAAETAKEAAEAAKEAALRAFRSYATRAAFVADGDALTLPEGAIVVAGGFSYRRVVGATDIPDRLGYMPVEPRSLMHYGWVGNGTLSDQKRGNLAFLRAGRVVLDTPGLYTYTNSNPIAEAFPTGSEAHCNWWAVRRAFYIGRDDVIFEIGPGVQFVAAPGADCHFLQKGQPGIAVNDASGVQIGTVPHVAVSNVWTIGALPDIDLNRAAQTPSTGTLNNWAGVWVQNGAVNTRVSALRIRNGSYYGVALEGMGGTTEAGFTDCEVDRNVITDCLADGIDCKDFGTNNSAVHIHSNRIINCGAGGDGFLSPQAGIDVRGGALVENNLVQFTDAFIGQRVGIRAQYSTTFAESEMPSMIRNNAVRGNGLGSLTWGLRIIGANVSTSGNMVRDFTLGCAASAPSFKAVGDQIYDCSEGVRLQADAAAGWQADNAILDALDLTRNGTGIRFDACARPTVTSAAILGGSIGYDVREGASGIRIIGGVNGATTRLQRAGSGSLVISDVANFPTEITGLVPIDVASTGVKTVTFAHGLPFTPALSEITVTLQDGSGSPDDFVLAVSPRVVSVTSTIVTIKTRVTVASAIPGAQINARVRVDAFQR